MHYIEKKNWSVSFSKKFFKRLFETIIKEKATRTSTVVPKRGGGGGGRGAAAPLPFCQEGQGGQYCPFRFGAMVTKQTLANLKARLSNAE